MAILKRRKKRKVWRKAREYIWPSMGWPRTWSYYKNRVVRIPDSSYSIAAGLAFGCAISFTPAFGTHILQSALFCWIFRASFLAAALGTVFGNPVTFPILWTIGGTVGFAMFDLLGLSDFLRLDDVTIPRHPSEILDMPVRLLLPIMIGGYTVGLISYPFFYYSFRTIVRQARAAHIARRRKKLHKQVRDMTGQKD